ncbi:Hypothetical predicted protein [Podarcis lilfordi]|uniref:Uncharacterized protein n=1 Tax=Podarcis lilfordi TaxID=74358 RepID=A0AA35NXQ9_9SAUR|nr:Hypothetical predicted protein [Podarcis lilfordi]
MPCTVFQISEPFKKTTGPPKAKLASSEITKAQPYMEVQPVDDGGPHLPLGERAQGQEYEDEPWLWKKLQPNP